MLIAFSGAQSTGKTTILDRLRKEEICKDLLFVSEITRDVANTGFKINEDGDEDTQLQIVGEHVKRSCYRNAVVDRCILDGMVYSKFLHETGKIGDEVLDYISTTFRFLIPKYNVIFYFEPNIPLVRDGVRSENIFFRDRVIQLFEHYIRSNHIDVIRVNQGGEDRYKIVYDTVEKILREVQE